MKNYILKTTATMKPHNSKNWWIDPGIVREIHITAENVRDALNQYREIVEDKYYITVSDNALRNKLDKTFPGLACNVRFEHQDAAGWWYTFELVNDSRRQTFAVRESDIDDAARA